MTGLAARAHPLTVITLALASAAAAFILPGPRAPAVFYAAVLAGCIGSGAGRAGWQAALVVGPLWFFLFLLHGVLGPEPGLTVAGLRLSREGLETALVQGSRLGAAATATLAALQAVQPARLLDAVVERGWSFHAAYLLVATLDAGPRFARKAGAILAAQRTRGLRLRGGPLRRISAVVPLTMPLILGALAEVDERAAALDMRGADLAVARTPLHPPRDSATDRALRALAILGVLALVLMRAAG